MVLPREPGCGEQGYEHDCEKRLLPPTRARPQLSDKENCTRQRKNGYPGRPATQSVGDGNSSRRLRLKRLNDPNRRSDDGEGHDGYHQQRQPRRFTTEEGIASHHYDRNDNTKFLENCQATCWDRGRLARNEREARKTSEINSQILRA